MADSVSKLRQFFRRALGKPPLDPVAVRPEDTPKEAKPQTSAIVSPAIQPPTAIPAVNAVPVSEPVTPRRPAEDPLKLAILAIDNPFPNKVTGLSATRMGTGWRNMLCDGETRVFDALAVLERRNRYDRNAVRIDIVGFGNRVKLGYLTAAVAATFRTACTEVAPDSEMGQAIKAQSIPCLAQVYCGDIYAGNETDRYSYASTDVVRRVKDVVKAERKLKTLTLKSGPAPDATRKE